MRRRMVVHVIFTVLVFLIISLVRNFLTLDYWPFWLGALVGMFLPDIDHLVYIYFLRPQELTSQRVVNLVNNKNISGAFSLMGDTNSERSNRVFHTIVFQLIFLILTFWIVSSSLSLFGTGIVLAVSLHLLIDQVYDFKTIGNLESWFRNMPIALSIEGQKIYMGLLALVLFVFGFIF